jgi:Polyketide cyclase / dehydrase and lipid transport
MTVLIIILCIVAIPFVIALFTSNQFKLEREITINKPKQEVFNYLKYLKNHDTFAVWMTFDPNMKREFTGTDGTVGFTSAWESTHKKVGSGKQTLKGIKDGEEVDMEIQFIKPWENRADAYLKTEAMSDNQTKVKWGFYNTVKYPMKVMRVFMNMEKMIGNDFDKGLARLKEVMER